MEMRQCENGHYYDVSVNPNGCPYCNQQGGETIPLASGAADSGKTMPLGYGATAPVAGATTPLNASAANDDGRTVAMIQKEIGIDPVVGWLVCVDGVEKGKDYRIHADNNYIGRSEKMDICIRNDDTISRENHAIISYDTRENVFFFSPGDGRSIVRINDKAQLQTAELKPYDKIEIGNTKLVFIPFCGENYTWNK